VCRPTDKRRVPGANSGGTSHACNTLDTETWPGAPQPQARHAHNTRVLADDAWQGGPTRRTAILIKITQCRGTQQREAQQRLRGRTTVARSTSRYSHPVLQRVDCLARHDPTETDAEGVGQVQSVVRRACDDAAAWEAKHEAKGLRHVWVRAGRGTQRDGSRCCAKTRHQMFAGAACAAHGSTRTVDTVERLRRGSTREPLRQLRLQQVPHAQEMRAGRRQLEGRKQSRARTHVRQHPAAHAVSSIICARRAHARGGASNKLCSHAPPTPGANKRLRESTRF
jgi:hypothetical protein